MLRSREKTQAASRRGRIDEAPPPNLAALPDPAQRSLSADAALLTTATYAAQILIFVAGVIQKGLLGPTGTGYWTLMGTAWLAFTLTSLGVVAGAMRQIPHYRGRGEPAKAASTADTAFTFSQLASTSAGVALVCASLAFGSDWAPELQWGLVLLGLTAPLRNLVDAHEGIFQATKRFVPLSAGLVVKAAVMLSVQTAFVVMFGFYGMFAGLVALNVAALVTYWRLHVAGRRNPAFHYRLDRRRVGELVRFGIPLYAFTQAWALFFAVDSLIVAGFVGVRQLGYYALAVSITSYVILLPRSVVQTVFPRMQERYSATEDPASVQGYAQVTQLVLAFMLVPPFVAAAYFLLPVLIRQALPAFEPAIAVTHIMVAGSFVIALVELPMELLITIGRRWQLSAVMVGALLLNGAANYVAVGPLDGGIEGAAYATVLSYLVLLTVVSAYGFGSTGGRRVMFRQLAELAGVLVWTLGWMALIEAAFGPGGGPLPSDLANGLAKFLASLITLAPWLYYVERRFGGLTMLRGKLASLIRVARTAIRRDRGDLA